MGILKIGTRDFRLSADRRRQSGQAMLVATLFISGLILSATTIAGLLLFYQIRGVSNAAASARAFFAADSGAERSLYCYLFKQVEGGVGNKDCDTEESNKFAFSNGALFWTDLQCWGVGEGGEEKMIDCKKCQDKDDKEISCDVRKILVKSFGESDKAARNLETIIDLRSGD